MQFQRPKALKNIRIIEKVVFFYCWNVMAFELC